MKNLTKAVGTGFCLILWLCDISPAQNGDPPTVKRVIGLTYPRLAQLADAEGRVELIAKVSTDGSVEKVTVVAGKRLFTDAAKRALAQWLFSSCDATSGRTCEARVIFEFVLLNGTCDSSNCPSEFRFDFPNIATVRSKHFIGPIE